MFNELRMKKFKSAVQFGIFLPYFISWIVVGLFSYNLFNYEHGSLNTLLKLFGMEAINWYENPKMWVVILVVFRVWKMTGYGMIMYIAALGGIDTTYYEAAKIDGANGFQVFRKITFPLIMPAVSICMLTSLTFAFKLFDIIMVFTKGGPANSTVTVAYNIYKEAFVNSQYGMATAKSLVFVVFVLIVTAIQLKVTKSKEVEA